MQDEQNKNLRLRIRLKSGEEFEAEGDITFISRQKEAFLNLIGNAEEPQTKTARPAAYNGPLAQKTSPQAQLFQAQNETVQPPQPQILPSYLKTAQTAKAQNTVHIPAQDVWDKIAYSDGEDIIIRRKDKNLKPSSAALIILGAAKVLKNRPSLSALELSKSLKLSGYLKGDLRLDRAVAAEIKDSSIVFEGSKRNRFYSLTQKGLAKAFTTAEKIILAEDKQNRF